ncbi:hypothetical protein [Nonomuraea dietziae]|uniref:hypothetical protein n=1 Tax=Nonomuraea dietziae TaxID=65515 RepID=UPI0034195821
MARFHIDGEIYEVDANKLMMHEGIAVQRATGLNARALAAGLEEGDSIALAAYVWIIFKFRKGMDVTWQQIESGEHPINLATIKVEVDEVDPTEAAPATAATSSDGD